MNPNSSRPSGDGTAGTIGLSMTAHNPVVQPGGVDSAHNLRQCSLIRVPYIEQTADITMRSPWMSLACSLLAGVILAGGLATRAWADKRVALVVGNANYVNVPPLSNPTNDAEDVTVKLRKLGFDVVTGFNLDLPGWRAALQEFERKAASSDAALFYYAGHAMQYQGQNYLLPTSAVLKDETSLIYDMISVNAVKEVFVRANARIRIMILDACRNNPLADNFARSISGSTRNLPALTRGLARVDKPEGMVIVYATMADEVAEDGKATRNSPFTSALLARMEQPGVEIATLFRQVQGDVMAKTGNKQKPELNIAMADSFFFNTAETDTEFWVRIRDSGDPRLIREFIISYPRSPHVGDAEYRLSQIENAGKREADDRKTAEERETAKAKRELEARQKAEADAAAARQAHEDRLRDAEDARRQSEFAAAAKRDTEARQKAESDAAALRKADDERQRAAEEAKRQAEFAAAAKRDAEARQKAEAEAAAQRKAEEERQRTAEEARRQAENVAAVRRDSEARQKAEAEAAAQRRVLEERQRAEAEAEARRQADEAQRREAQAKAQPRIAAAEVNWGGAGQEARLLMDRRRELEATAKRSVSKCVVEAKALKTKSSPQELEARLAVEVRAQIQSFLIDRGYFDGEADGTFGQSSRQAIKKFQQELGVISTGYLTFCELQSLQTPK